MKGFPRIDWHLWLGFGIAAALFVNVGLALSITQPASGEKDPFAGLEITFLTTPACPHCFDLQPLREYLKENGVTDEQITEVTYDSRQGKKLIKKYEIARVPTAIIPGSLTELEFMAGIVENIGEIRKEALVVTELQPPYIDLASGETTGEFELIILDDASCETCYDTSLHDDVLLRLTMKPSVRTVVDIASEEGKSLIDSYVINAVPTILLRGDMESYESLQEIWPSVGTIEDDGTFVLRSGVANMGTYKRLPDGQIVEPEPAVAETNP